RRFRRGQFPGSLRSDRARAGKTRFALSRSRSRADMRFATVTSSEATGPRAVAETRDGRFVPLAHGESLLHALPHLDDVKLSNAPVVPHHWHPPVPEPRTFRDFYAFEQHVSTAR